MKHMAVRHANKSYVRILKPVFSCFGSNCCFVPKRGIFVKMVEYTERRCFVKKCDGVISGYRLFHGELLISVRSSHG